jgi:hypothetical protein
MIGNNGLRYYKILMIENRELGPEDILVIGSSRTLPLGEQWGVKNILNLSVTGTHINDIEIMIDHFVKKKYKNTLVLSLDPWIFNDNNPEKRYEFEYKRDFSNELKRMASVGYFKKNIDLLFFYKRNPGLVDTIFGDGSRKYLKDHDCKISCSLTRDYLFKKDYLSDEFKNFRISNEYLSTLDRILEKSKKFEKVIVWMQPLNPIFIENPEVKRIKEITLQSEQNIKDRCIQFNCDLYGSFFQNMDSCSFEDHKHLNRSKLAKEFNNLINRKTN